MAKAFRRALSVVTVSRFRLWLVFRRCFGFFAFGPASFRRLPSDTYILLSSFFTITKKLSLSEPADEHTTLPTSISAPLKA